MLELRALQRRPAAEQGSVDATAMDISPGALRVVVVFRIVRKLEGVF